MSSGCACWCSSSSSSSTPCWPACTWAVEYRGRTRRLGCRRSCRCGLLRAAPCTVHSAQAARRAARGVACAAAACRLCILFVAARARAWGRAAACRASRARTVAGRASVNLCVLALSVCLGGAALAVVAAEGWCWYAWLLFSAGDLVWLMQAARRRRPAACATAMPLVHLVGAALLLLLTVFAWCAHACVACACA